MIIAGLLALFTVLTLSSAGFRALLPATPQWILESQWGQTWLPRAIASVAENPSCEEEAVVPGLSLSDRIDLRLQ